MTLITIKTDVYQTWMFNIVWKRSFIEREHVSDDTLGFHTIPENLETGPYKVYNHLSDSYNSDISLITLSTVGPSDLENYSMNVYHNIPTPGVYCKWTNIGDLSSFINTLNNNDKISAITAMFIAPQWLAPATHGTVYVDTGTPPPQASLGISRIDNLDGYVPRNKKLLCYPYCYIGVSNGMGQYNIYKQEKWDLNANNEMSILMRGVLTPGGSIRAFPELYNGDGLNVDDSLTIGKFPQLAWSNDLYTNWQTQNGVNIGGIRLSATESAIGKSILKIGVGAGLASTGNPLGAGFIGTGISDIYGAVQENYQHSLVPNAVEGSINSGDVSTMVGINRLHAYRMGISQEYAKVIDQYFDLYGYKVNTVKIPNITNRTNWNYLKTIGANLEGDIPENDINELKSMLNNGVTFWHNPNTYLDYSQSNSVL
jgi:hypothetical protein